METRGTWVLPSWLPRPSTFEMRVERCLPSICRHRRARASTLLASTSFDETFIFARMPHDLTLSFRCLRTSCETNESIAMCRLSLPPGHGEGQAHSACDQHNGIFLPDGGGRPADPAQTWRKEPINP